MMKIVSVFDAINEFNFKYNALLLNNQLSSLNHVNSATSIYMLLSMLLMGSKGNTAIELANKLGFDYSKFLECNKESNILETVKKEFSEVYKKVSNTSEMNNKIFYMNDLKEDYIDLVKTLFSIEYDKMDFSNTSLAVEIINNWASLKTQGKIKDIIQESDISSFTNFVILNTIFFKSEWQNKFNSSITTNRKFLTGSAETIDVPMMYMSQNFKYYENPKKNYTMVSIPFKINGVEAFFILPYRSSNIQELLNSLNKDDINEWKQMKHHPKVNVYIPKFKLHERVSLKDMLIKMGLVTLFDSNMCDLSGATSIPSFISNILHSADIEIDEGGVVAAAATAAAVTLRMTRPTTIDVTFMIDRTFLFMVYETSNFYPLFTAVISEPQL